MFYNILQLKYGIECENRSIYFGEWDTVNNKLNIYKYLIKNENK